MLLCNPMAAADGPSSSLLLDTSVILFDVDEESSCGSNNSTSEMILYDVDDDYYDDDEEVVKVFIHPVEGDRAVVAKPSLKDDNGDRQTIKKATSFSPTVATTASRSCMTSLAYSFDSIDDDDYDRNKPTLLAAIPNSLEIVCHGEGENGELTSVSPSSTASTFSPTPANTPTINEESSDHSERKSAHKEEGQGITNSSNNAEKNEEVHEANDDGKLETLQRSELIHDEVDNLIQQVCQRRHLRFLLQQDNKAEKDLIGALKTAANQYCHILGSIEEETSGPTVLNMILYGNGKLLKSAARYYYADDDIQNQNNGSSADYDDYSKPLFMLRYGPLLLDAAQQTQHAKEN